MTWNRFLPDQFNNHTCKVARDQCSMLLHCMTVKDVVSKAVSCVHPYRCLFFSSKQLACKGEVCSGYTQLSQAGLQ